VILFWFSCLFGSAGVSIITCLFMEAYHQRRAQEEVGRYDKESA